MDLLPQVLARGLTLLPESSLARELRVRKAAVGQFQAPHNEAFAL